jgi:hypothetical protein
MEAMVQVKSESKEDASCLERTKQVKLLTEAVVLAPLSWALLHVIRALFGVLLVLTRLREQSARVASTWSPRGSSCQAEAKAPCHWRPLDAAAARCPLRLLGSMAIGPR